MHMFDTAWQRTAEHQHRLLRSADLRRGWRTAPRHPLPARVAE